MKKFTVTVQADIVVSFDENSEEFKELFEGYKESIDSDADYEMLANSIVSLISRYGVSEHIEGVGYVRHNGEKQRIYANGEYEDIDSCINVEVETDLNNMVEFDIYYTQEENE